MSSQPSSYLTPEEYLEVERRAERKSEYFRGEMFAMAGATRRHILIVTNLVRELSQQLMTKPCEVYSTDMRLRVSPTGLYTYPDVLVVCGEPQFADDQQDTLLNPVLVIEVLSPSTEDYDRGRKFGHYRKLPSLMEYVTVAQDEPRIEKWTRMQEDWRFAEYNDLGRTIQLASIGAALPLSEVYNKLDFAAPAPALPV
jgi:Uma2 family endonuclease